MFDDWYLDANGTKQYDPNVKSQEDLASNQKYIGETDVDRDKNGNVTANYKADGSILYKNETDAYNRIWSQANIHYNKEKEAGGFVLDNNKVLVMPEYLNKADDCSPSKYGYNVNKDGILSKGTKKYKILGEIHTHQNPLFGGPSPSIFNGRSNNDVGYSKDMGGLPIFTIGYDGLIHGKYYSEIKSGYSYISGLGSSNDLLKGIIKLAPWLQTYPTKGQ